MDTVNNYYQTVQKAFVKLAPYYDLITLPVVSLREQVADLIAPRGSGKRHILDVATGTGAQALAFARRGHDVVGTDLSEAMLAIAQKKNQAGKVKFEVADATALPYPSDSFDVSCISFGLHEMPLTIRQEALTEMVRVTRAEGTMAVVDYALPKNRLGRWLIYRFVRSYEGEYYVQFIDSDLRELLRQVSIEVIAERALVFGGARLIIGRKALNHARQSETAI
ncbi:MAG: methyltransferase domain-containing protein [Anaerolineae bacterium]|nr:methyltransferase domain-containing protein [Anaerolineae bacterium]